MRFRSQKTWVISQKSMSYESKSPWVTSQKSMSYESKVHELWDESLWVRIKSPWVMTLTDFKVDFNKKTLIQCCHNVYSVYRCICFCISVGQNLLFTSLQISVEPYFLNFRMLFPKLITDYRPTNDRLVTDIVNISESVTPLYSYTSTIYAK